MPDVRLSHHNYNRLLTYLPFSCVVQPPFDRWRHRRCYLSNNKQTRSYFKGALSCLQWKYRTISHRDSKCMTDFVSVMHCSSIFFKRIVMPESAETSCLHYLLPDKRDVSPSLGASQADCATKFFCTLLFGTLCLGFHY